MQCALVAAVALAGVLRARRGACGLLCRVSLRESRAYRKLSRRGRKEWKLVFLPCYLPSRCHLSVSAPRSRHFRLCLAAFRSTLVTSKLPRPFAESALAAFVCITLLYSTSSASIANSSDTCCCNRNQRHTWAVHKGTEFQQSGFGF